MFSLWFLLDVLKYLGLIQTCLKALTFVGFAHFRFAVAFTSSRLAVAGFASAAFVLTPLDQDYQLLVPLPHVAHKFLEFICLDGEKFGHFDECLDFFVVVSIVEEFI
jgi:hypothetical protein